MSDLQRLQQYFERRPNVTIALPTLGRVMSPYSVTKRISELRAMGHRIANTKRVVRGKVHSAYIWIA